MKKTILALIATMNLIACENENGIFTQPENTFIAKGYSNIVETRTSFGNPTENKIPYKWSNGDFIWLGENRSNSITEDCEVANFKFEGGTAIIGTGHIFYNMTGTAKTAYVLAEQTADGNLGNDGDFGYAVLDEYNSFYLSHKTSYIWFNTTTNDADMPKLASIRLATNGVAIAGKRVFNFTTGEWEANIAESCSEITLNFEGGFKLESSYEAVMAAMVVLPSEVGGTELTVTYTFEDGRTFTETKNPTNDFVAGATARISTVINKENLVSADSELDYVLKVLTFEDKDVRFSPYLLDYADGWSGRDIEKWSDLIDDPQYGGPLTYADQMSAQYYWYDEGNTELFHLFPDNGGLFCFWGGGHAVSNYWGTGYSDDDRNVHIAKYYGQSYVDQWAGKPGADGALGWFLLQLMAPAAPHSGENFIVHYGYKDFFNYIENLPELSFADEQPRVIDHMYVTNTLYTLNQLHNGVKSEEGNSFGGNWTGLTEEAWMKIVAYGYRSPDADPLTDEADSEAEFYLVNGMNVVEDWQKWDLSGLGEVAKVRFNFLYSDEMGGRYGFTIPGYFAYDDVAVRFPKE